MAALTAVRGVSALATAKEISKALRRELLSLQPPEQLPMVELEVQQAPDCLQTTKANLYSLSSN